MDTYCNLFCRSDNCWTELFKMGKNAMKYLFYNIRNLAKHEKFIFAIMLVCVFVSAWIMTFSYGLYQNYHALIQEGEQIGKSAAPEIAEGKTFTYGDFKSYLDALPNDLLNGSDLIMCMSDYSYENATQSGDMLSQILFSRFTVRNGKYQISSAIAESWANKGMITGSFLSDEDERLGNNVVMVRDQLDQFSKEANANLIIDDYTAMIYGKEYKIIGKHTSNGLIVPFLSVPAETSVYQVSIRFEKTMTKKIYSELIETANEVIPGKLIFPELELPDRESLYIYNNIMMISVFIAILTIVNFASLYNYIFGKRRRQLTIMRICGCTAARAVGICLGECCMICVPMFLAGMLTYIPFMKYVLSSLFEYMEASYSVWIYAAIFGIYIIMLISIMSIFLSGQIKKTLAEGRKEGA